MMFLKLLLSFAPWISFLVIAHGSLLRLKVGIGIALFLSVIMGALRLHRGIILWTGLGFFTYAAIAVIGMDNMWAVHTMGVFASGALALGTWTGVAMKRPFTIDYAREHVDPSVWQTPAFLRSNYFLTSLWGSVFTINAILAFGKMHAFLLSDLGYELISYALMIGTAAFTSWYPEHKRHQATKAD